MKVTVFGANGKVGSLVVAQLLEQGYKVVAFIHSNDPFTAHPNLYVVKGDIYDAELVTKAIKGSDMVISALSSWGTPKKDVLTAAMQNIIPAMAQAKIKRIVSLTGSEATSRNDPKSLFHGIVHGILKTGRMRVLIDGDEHIRLLENSELDWTVIRSPVMNERGDPRKYKLASRWPQPWATIHRQAVAICMVSQLRKTSCLYQAPFIVRK